MQRVMRFEKLFKTLKVVIMRNLAVFYLLIALPLAAISLLARYNYLSPVVGGVLLLIYCFVYHPTISGWRLVSLGKIPEQMFWKNYIPMWNLKYFRTLFFGA